MPSKIVKRFNARTAHLTKNQRNIILVYYATLEQKLDECFLGPVKPYFLTDHEFNEIRSVSQLLRIMSNFALDITTYKTTLDRLLKEMPDPQKYANGYVKVFYKTRFINVLRAMARNKLWLTASVFNSGNKRNLHPMITWE